MLTVRGLPRGALPEAVASETHMIGMVHLATFATRRVFDRHSTNQEGYDEQPNQGAPFA